MPQAPEGFWAEQAAFNECFARFLEKVDGLCDRFLDISLADIEHNLEAYDCYEAGMTPETFFKESVIPFVRDEQGCDWIDQLVGHEIMWGGRAWVNR